MKKRVVIIALILILAGCQTPFGQAPAEEEEQPQEYRSGTEGLRMEFLPNMPPPQIVAGRAEDEFNAMVRVENMGSEDLGNVNNHVYLSGFDNQILTLKEADAEQKIGPLEGRGPFMPRGEFAMLNYKANINLESNIDKYVPRILAIACYNYKTTASAQVCLDPDPYSPFSKEKACTPQTVSLGSQGAPIAVTQVEVIPAPSKTRFTIHIQNAGRGHVFKDETASYNHCNPYKQGLGYDELNKVKITGIKLSGEDVQKDCKPIDKDGYLALVNGQATLHCETEVTGDNAYLTPLTVELSYGYRQSISTQVEIRSSGVETM